MGLYDDKHKKDVSSKARAEIAFSKAISKALAQELKALLFRRSKKLLPFDDIKERLDLWYGSDIGVKTVPLNSIIGSQGRYRNFTRHFFPLEENLRNRWKQIEIAVESGKELPPVELYKVCNAYFVKDGHHRVSVAKAKKKISIEAKVFEYNCDLSLDDKTDFEQIAILESYRHFLKETGLKEKGYSKLHLTVIGGYPILMEHIHRHRFYLEEKEKRRINVTEAAVSWFDNIYSPMRDLIIKNGILEKFPHRTEADFYIWISKYKNRLFQNVISQDEVQGVINSYLKFFSNPLRKFFGKIRRYFGLVKY